MIKLFPKTVSLETYYYDILDMFDKDVIDYAKLSIYR